MTTLIQEVQSITTKIIASPDRAEIAALRLERAAIISTFDAGAVETAWRTMQREAQEPGLRLPEHKATREALYGWVELRRRGWVVSLPNTVAGDRVFWSGVPVKVVEVLDTQIIVGGQDSDYIEDETRHVARCRVELDLTGV